VLPTSWTFFYPCSFSPVSTVPLVGLPLSLPFRVRPSSSLGNFSDACHPQPSFPHSYPRTGCPFSISPPLGSACLNTISPSVWGSTTFWFFFWSGTGQLFLVSSRPAIFHTCMGFPPVSGLPWFLPMRLAFAFSPFPLECPGFARHSRATLWSLFPLFCPR